MITKPLPRIHARPFVPPIKCQGIKTKLVSFILENIQWRGDGRWIEPFLGSGVVLFSVQPKRAIANDVNPHIIAFYQKIYDGSLTSVMVREHLTREGKRLFTEGEEYYYEVRKRFNKNADPLDFLFLNRACFNGVMRFNKKGEFNVPFCRKPDRFRRAYITKIVNQVNELAKIMKGKEWEFRVGDWRECFTDSREDDFVYLDPPYIGRHTDYYNQWSENDATELAHVAQTLSCGFALSMWKENRYRSNSYLRLWNGVEQRTMTHFYHVGSTESLRNSMEEALLIKQGYDVPLFEEDEISSDGIQMSMAI
jgi:DNA adenine methylase